VPVLLIQERTISTVPGSSSENRNPDVVGQAHRSLENCGHTPHLDQPERTIEAMKEFVKEVLECATCRRFVSGDCRR